MKFILVFTFSITDEILRTMAEKDGYSDISEYSGEWYYPIERPYLPQLGGEHIFQYPNAFSGTLYFDAEYIYDDIINGTVFVHVSLRDAEEGFESLINGLEDGWKHGEGAWDEVTKLASSAED